jgi:hypothetical protein
VAASPHGDGGFAHLDGIAIWVALALSIRLTNAVLLKLERVQKSGFAFGKADLLMTLSTLFSAAELTFESERALEVALQLFRTGSKNTNQSVRISTACVTGPQGARP